MSALTGLLRLGNLIRTQRAGRLGELARLDSFYSIAAKAIPAINFNYGSF
jgi:hypothetical protein